MNSDLIARCVVGAFLVVYVMGLFAAMAWELIKFSQKAKP